MFAWWLWRWRLEITNKIFERVLFYWRMRFSKHEYINWSQNYDEIVGFLEGVVRSSVQLLSCVWLFGPHEPQHARPPCPSPTPRVHPPMSIEPVMPSNHLILCHPILLLPSIFHSIRVFSNEPALHMRWPKYWSFSFSISPSNEYSGLISFRMDWLDLLAIQGIPKSLLQHHNL